MNSAITITPIQICEGFLYICGGITCVIVAFTNIHKVFKAANAPNDIQNDRLDILEKTIKRHDELFQNDNKRLIGLEDGNRVTQRAILALLAHGIDGNEIDAMKKAKEDLQQYLIDGKLK
jgi:hypothetical protein